MIITKNDYFLLQEIVKKNFAAKYKDSVLGIFWSVLKPLMIMIVFTIVFSSLFESSIENYAVYFLSAKCIYDFFIGGVGISMMAIKGNQNILKKNATKKYLFVLGCVFSEFLNFIISLIILVAVMIATNATFHFGTIPLSIIPVISLFLMIIGFGLILSILCVYYADVQHFWSVFTLILMYSTALFYPVDIIPEPYRSYVILNPLFWIISQFRDFVVYGVMHDFLNMVNTVIFSLIILVLGIIIFKKYEKQTVMKF